MSIVENLEVFATENALNGRAVNRPNAEPDFQYVYYMKDALLELVFLKNGNEEIFIQGNGQTPARAEKDFAAKISGKTVIFRDKNTRGRVHVRVPDLNAENGYHGV